MGRHCCRRKRTTAEGREPPSEPGNKRQIFTTRRTPRRVDGEVRGQPRGLIKIAHPAGAVCAGGVKARGLV